MLSINKIYSWLFVIALLIQIPSIHLMKFLDELLVVFMMSLVFLDVLVNKQYAKYKVLWVVFGVMFFYALYTFVFRTYNIPKAICIDFIAQLKPFCYFCVSYAVVPKLGRNIKILLKNICVFNSIIVLFCFLMGLTEDVFFHVTYLGLVSVISFMVYIICSIDENNKLSKRDLIIALMLLTIGLVSTRTKFYGEYIVALYLLLLYTPGVLKKKQTGNIIVGIIVLGVMLVVSWSKIDYYFISGGNLDMAFDEDLLETFARPVMYISMFSVLALHPILGSGLASYGTYASMSAVNYSLLYGVIGIDDVWGLSENYDAFICDAFYPELAQFGVLGIGLFIFLFVWMYRKISLFLYTSGKLFYVVGIVAFMVLMIENVASTTFNQGAGAMCMMILGYLCASFKHITKEEAKKIRENPYVDKNALEYLK